MGNHLNSRLVDLLEDLQSAAKDEATSKQQAPLDAKDKQVSPKQVTTPDSKGEAKELSPKDEVPKDEAPKDEAPKDESPKDAPVKSVLNDKTQDEKSKAPTKVDTGKSKWASQIESVKSKLVDKDKTKSTVSAKKSAVKPNSAKSSHSGKSVSDVSAEVCKIQSLPGAKVAHDEQNLERQGFIFQRQSIAFTSRSYIYPAKGLTSVPVVCKLTLLDCCSPRTRENLVKNSARILRYIGGNGSEPPHSAFIRVYEIFKVDLKFYVFMDQVGKESVLDMIKSRDKFSQDEARRGMKQITDAVQFIQKRGIAHRSIMIDHVLFDSNKQAKLTGWGRAVFYLDPTKGKILSQNKEVKSMTNSHMPPEAFEGAYDPARADNWSLGVLLAALHTRRHVFKIKSKVDFGKQWTDFVAKHRFSPIVLDLLKAVFVIEPSKRVTVGQILAHQYWTASAKEIEQPKKASAKPKVESAVSDKAVKSSTSTGTKENDEETTGDIEANSTEGPKPVASEDVPLEEGPGSEIPKEDD